VLRAGIVRIDFERPVELLERLGGEVAAEEIKAVGKRVEGLGADCSG